MLRTTSLCYIPSLYSLCALEGPHIWLIFLLGLVDKYPVYGVRLSWCSYTQAIPEVSIVFALAPELFTYLGSVNCFCLGEYLFSLV